MNLVILVFAKRRVTPSIEKTLLRGVIRNDTVYKSWAGLINPEYYVVNYY